MSQISPPVRIVAVAAVALIAVYMAFLRPKSPSVTPAPAATPTGNVHTGKPAVTSFGKAVQAAQGAAKATEKQGQGEVNGTGSASSSSSSTSSTSSSSSSTTKSSSSSTSAPKPAAPAIDVAGLPRPVAHAIRQHKVLALLFWNGRSADDRAVHSALRHIERFHGSVYVHTAPLGQIARYGRITRGADVEQSPTIVVVDRNLQATTLVGYVDQDTIQQAVVDALRADGGIFAHDKYLRTVNKMCSATTHDLFAIPRPTSIPQARHDLARYSDRWDGFVKSFRAVPAPAKWRAFKRATISDLSVIKASNHRLVRGLNGHPSLSNVLHMAVTEVGIATPAGKRFNHRMDRNGLIYCGSQG